jgi:tape measure domain-containing protein
VAQSTVKLIVDAQNAISPLKRVNEQTKALSSSTDKLKGRLDKSNRSLKNTGKSAKTASAGVGGLVGALKPLLAALAVIGTARFIFIKTAELETQRKSLEQLTGSLEETNKIIDELQAFGAVTPFTSSELIEQTKRLKAFGFETEELVDTTKRLSDVAGATGADLTGIATAFGQIRAKGKLQQEENLQLLERGVNITDELKKITKLQGDEFESAMRKGEIGADLVNQALINLTSQGAIFAGGATKQADTLNGKLSTLQDTVDTLARTIGEDLSEEIKGVIDLAIAGVKQINKLIERIAVANKVGRLDLANIAMEARKEARELVKEEFGISFVPIFSDAAKREKELFEVIKKRKIEEALTTKEKKKQNKETTKLTKSIKESKDQAEEIKNKTQGTTLAFTEGLIPSSDLFNKNLDLSGFFLNDINNDTLKISDSFQLIKTDADLLNEKFMEIGQSVEQGIVSNLTDAVMGTQSLGQSAINVLNNLKRKLIEVQIERAVSGIGDNIGGFLGGVFGGGKKSSSNSSSLIGNTASSFLGGAIPSFVGGGISSLLGFADGGRPPVGRASLVGEKGPEIFVPSTAGTIIPNNKIGGGTTNNYVTVNVEAGGATASGNNVDLNALGQVIGVVVQAQLVKEKQAGGILAR